MRKAVWVLLDLGMIVLGLAGTAGVAQADLPQGCQDLMNQYATAPDQLDANALAALRYCQAAANQAPPQRQPVEAASPGATRIHQPQPGWGQWPTSSAWSDVGATSHSWGDHISE
jgi:hypothetical protein